MSTPPKIPRNVSLALQIAIVAVAAWAFMTITTAHARNPVKHPDYRFKLKVDERHSRFNRRRLTAAGPGWVQVKLAVPSSARGRHGIALRGRGFHERVKAVAPGHYSMLTIELPAGRYAVYDSYKQNRRHGYKATLVVRRG